MRILKSSITVFCLIFSLFNSCRTFGGRPEVSDFSSYTDEDALKNEKERIYKLLEQEPVEALWRAIRLQDDEVLELCKKSVSDNCKKALEEKDYFSALNYARSFEACNFSSEDFSSSEISSLLFSDVPGLVTDSSHNPSNINECVNATVTVLVDKGLKIQYGSGMADRVLGSGFFIDKRGYIVTNYHVIDAMVNPSYEGFSRLYIKLQNSEEDKIPAKVIGYDPLLDLALIKAEVDAPFVLELGSSKDLTVGDKVNVIGAPLGLEGSISSGIVSYTERKLFSTGNVFQIDAPVNSGNSGGPCIDVNMKVQAIVFAGILDSQGLNFAIPVEFLKQELPFLYQGGKINHSWAGAYGHTSRMGKKKNGLEIQYVKPGSFAYLSGLRNGDVIYRAGEKEINSFEDMQSFLRENTSGNIVRFFYRNNESENNEALVYLENRPESPALEVYKSDLIENSFLPLFGMKLTSVSSNKKRFMVTQVLPNSISDEYGFSENDLLTIREVAFEKEKEFIMAQVVTQRHKKSIIDVMMVLSASYDNPYYF